jgi:hypothetical protein
VIVGAGSQDVKIPLVLTMTKEIDIRGVFRYANDYPIALAMVASGKVTIIPGPYLEGPRAPRPPSRDL